MQKKKKRAKALLKIANKKKICVAFMLCIISVMVFRGLMQLPQIAENKKMAARLSEQIEYEKERQSEIDELKTKVDTDEYIEKVASEKLGLVKKNAKIFIDTSSEEQGRK